MHTILFILGTPYCGSTFLASLLSEYDHVFNVGELDRVSGVGNNQNPFHSNWCKVCSTGGQECPVFDEKLIEDIRQASNHTERYAKLAQATGKSILVDGSKHAYWLNAVCAENNVKTMARPIILVRNPIRFILSSKSRHADFQWPMWKWAEIWRDTYIDLMRSCSRIGIPYLIVRHEDLCADTDGVLGVIRDFSKIGARRIEDNETAFHYIGGNPEFNAKILRDKRVNVDMSEVDQASTEYIEARNYLLNTPGCFDLYHNIFGYS
ncbi:sulfotransferase [Aquitalea sp.]|uniref:sulfotransferase n=1 Tax=Aquitalea sp. TaxID=1872623 RepID=UPI00258DE89C|nr:sulfotransferase [Aquitalea sp.]